MQFSLVLVIFNFYRFDCFYFIYLFYHYAVRLSLRVLVK